MERQVIYRDRQELQAADLTNTQKFTAEAMEHLVLDAITAERMYVGLSVTTPSATEIQIAAGRLWAGDLGAVYSKDQAETLSIFAHLPVSDKRWLTISIIGQEQEHDIQPRDFLVDLQSGQTEPRSSAMELRRAAVTQITSGLESAEPQKPEPPTGYTVIAHVLLDTSGVEKIDQAENKKLMRLFEVWQMALANDAWIKLTDPKIATLISDLAALAEAIKGIAYAEMLVELARDVALLKDYQALPDAYSSYGADNFLDPDESDVENTLFYARVDEGVRFPWAGLISQQPGLFNPYAAEVENFNGLVLPAHEEVVRLATEGFSGGMSIGQYQYQTHEMKMGTRTRIRVRYGPTRTVCTNGANWRTGGYNFVKNVFNGPENGWQIQQKYGKHGNHYWLRIREYWRDEIKQNYWYVDTADHTINGSQIAQTFLNAQNGWLKKVDLYFTDMGEDGTVHLHLCETELGLPDPSRCLGRAEMEAAALSGHPAPTGFVFDQPIFLKAGNRYALLVTTAGDHDIATVQGTAYTHGTLFHSTDGSYFQGDFTKDLMMRFWYAQFANPRTTVELTSVSLSDGIADIDMLTEAVIPEGTELIMEYQKEGVGEWIPVSADTGEQLLGKPAMLSLRAVFVGSQDLMPGFSLSGSTFDAARPADNFKHISSERLLENASDNIDVILRLENWDGTKHTCTVKLISGETEYDPVSVTDTDITEAVNDPTIRRVFNFTPEAGTGISSYQIQIEGTTETELDIFHVAQRMDVAK